jgi:tRNA (adenine37-N6)-methyltransferase
MSFAITPIGRIETPFKRIADCPRNSRQIIPAPACSVTVFREHVEGLRDLDGFSHLILLYWLTDARPQSMVFQPPFASEPHGVFATRTPGRPNPIGLAVVALDGFAAPDRLMVRYLDCVDGTPLIDIKPYLPTIDAEPAATLGWLAPSARADRS